MSQTQYDAKVKFFDVMNDGLMETQSEVPEEKSSSLLPKVLVQNFATNKPAQKPTMYLYSKTSFEQQNPTESEN